MDDTPKVAASAKSKHNWKAASPFKEVLLRAITPEQIVQLSEKNPTVHLAYAGRQFGIVLARGSGAFP